MKKETGAEKEGGNLKKKRRNKANKAYWIKKKREDKDAIHLLCLSRKKSNFTLRRQRGVER